MHYLYTGTYQTPYSQENGDKITELRRNVCLYCTAIKYGLAGLATLAQEKIQNIKGGEVAVFDTLGIIKEAYQTMLGDDAGLTQYMKGEIKTAFEIDSGLFKKDSFIELFGEAKRFDRILMRIVAELFAEKIAAIYENTQLTINGSANDAIAPENYTRLPQHETLREELETVIIEESAVEYTECDVPAEAPTEYKMEYAVKDAECEVPTADPEEYAVECAVYGAQSWSVEAAAKAMREDLPECKKHAPFSWDWGAAAPSKKSPPAPVEEHNSLFCEESVAAKESVAAEEPPSVEKPTSVEEPTSVEKPPSVFCEETAAAPAASEEPTSVSHGRTNSAPAEDPPSVAAYTEPISIHFKEAISIATAEFAPIPNAEPTSVPDKKPAPLTKEWW